MAVEHTIDVRYAPASRWTVICRPTDPHKTLMRDDSALPNGIPFLPAYLPGSSDHNVIGSSGMLNLSHNLGFITGASVMGAVFAIGSATTDITTANPEA